MTGLLEASRVVLEALSLPCLIQSRILATHPRFVSFKLFSCSMSRTLAPHLSCTASVRHACFTSRTSLSDALTESLCLFIRPPAKCSVNKIICIRITTTTMTWHFEYCYTDGFISYIYCFVSLGLIPFYALYSVVFSCYCIYAAGDVDRGFASLFCFRLFRCLFVKLTTTLFSFYKDV